MTRMAYVKLFESILASTIWGEPQSTRIVWITMLALADRDGVVSASVPGLAHLARVSVEECHAALRSLAGPDADSRTKAHDGRRIEDAEGGWRILNYEFYRDKATIEERREKDRLRQERKRARDSSRNVTPVTEDHVLSPSQTQTQMHTQKKNPPTPQGGSGPTPPKPRKPATGPQADCVRWWEQEWARTRLGTPWAWSKKDLVGVATCLKNAQQAGSQEVQRRMTRLLEHRDPWMAENACPAILASKWNQLAVEVRPVPKRSKGDQALDEFERIQAAGRNGLDTKQLFGGQTQ